MKYTYVPSEERVREAMQQDEPMLAAITFDGEQAILSPIDDSMEHHIMLMNAGKKSTDIDQYFRIVFDRSGADWTFVCPPDYKGIPWKDKRIERFYKDGFAVISEFLHSGKSEPESAYQTNTCSGTHFPQRNKPILFHASGQ